MNLSRLLISSCLLLGSLGGGGARAEEPPLPLGPGWVIEERTWNEVFGDCRFPFCTQGVIMDRLGAGRVVTIALPPQPPGKNFTVGLGGMKGVLGATTARVTVSPWKGDIRGYDPEGTDPLTGYGCRRQAGWVHYRTTEHPERYEFACQVPSGVPLYLNLTGAWPDAEGQFSAGQPVCVPPLTLCTVRLFHEGPG